MAWLARLGDGRRPADILSLPLAEDIEDPMGGLRRGYERTRDALRELVRRLFDALS